MRDLDDLPEVIEVIESENEDQDADEDADEDANQQEEENGEDWLASDGERT